MRPIGVLVFWAALLCLFSFQTNDCASIPSKNKKIAAYMKTKIGKKVGDYCNDFFHEAYKAGGSSFHEVFGFPGLDFTKDCIYPGDMLLLQSVNITAFKGEEKFTVKYDNFATNYLIYKIRSKGIYTVARTETDNGKTTVTITEIDINNFKGKKPQIYHPV